ncbi:MAG: methylenetetrahydrofolate reductase [NAD(P)H] [Ruminococcaceae bacterium]|nr:methylenetetrahydrofolate reductase [NAD(P)H] [Oscillospiraceae bacterium]
MKIIDIIKGNKPSLSFEVFPPKTDTAFDSVWAATEELAALKPDFMSVTYGAGGGTSAYTAQIAQNLQDKFSVPTLAHLTCVSSTKKEIQDQLQRLKDYGISNILALRGDIPEGMDKEHLEYRYAGQLIEEIKEFGEFCIGGACYPETHPESETCAKDVAYLKEKVEQGCEFLTTQMFFDNNILYNFLYRIREAGITVPVVAGIMPVTNAAQMKRICAISQTALPQRFIRIVDRYGDKPEAMKQAGIAYATEQIIDLYANGINAVHVYTMNKPDIAAKIQNNISEIIR